MLLSAVLGGGHVVLTGGSTPRVAYQELAQALRSIERDFGEVTFWFGDERCVPPDDERSNYRLAKESLLDPLADVASPNVKRMKGELGPDEGADEYERELRAAGSPAFDLLLLGLGPDGHTASLFPGSPALDADPGRLVVMNEDPKGNNPHRRMTLTFSGIARARLAVVTVEGESKRDAFAAVRRGDADVPATRIQADHLIWLVDPAAAG
jgi:6-phosphogluconolactonase